MYAIVYPVLRIPIALFAATLVTTSLFFLMHLLVHSDDERAQEVHVIPIVDARMPAFEPIVEIDLQKPQPIEELEPVEAPDINREPTAGIVPGLTYSPDVFGIEPPGINGIALSDSEMIPIIQTTSAYPVRALQRRIEGFVVVSFTVDSNGDVVDPSVIYAEPEGYFERAALQTIRKWKYAARIENGKPVPVQGVQQRITFRINP